MKISQQKTKLKANFRRAEIKKINFIRPKDKKTARPPAAGPGQVGQLWSIAAIAAIAHSRCEGEDEEDWPGAGGRLQAPTRGQ